MSPTEIVRALESRGGVARAATLIRAGASREDLRRAVGRQFVETLRRGVYCVPWASSSVRLAALHGGELACASALRAHGIWTLAGPEPHVWVGERGRAHAHPGCSCITHRDHGRSAFGVVPLEQALVQVAACLGAEAFFAAFESAWNQNVLDTRARSEIRAALPARFRWLVDIARPDAQSGLESILRLRLHRLGIFLESQVWIEGVGRVDFVLAGRIILEVDGRENHEGPSQRRRDLRRDAAAAVRGYETLRFDYALVIHDWTVVEAAILARLAEQRRRNLSRNVGAVRVGSTDQHHPFTSAPRARRLRVADIGDPGEVHDTAAR